MSIFRSIRQLSSTAKTEASKTNPHVNSLAWILRLIAEFDAADQKARELVTGLSPEQLNWQPESGAWSVGQCLEHLCLMNEVYSQAISSALDGKPASVAQEITLGWFSRWFINNYSEPGSNKHARAPKKIVPSERVEPPVLDRFLRSNQVARELVRRAGDYDANRIRFRNPFIPLLRFTVGAGLEIISKHELRHILQAQRVKKSAGFPLESADERARKAI
jgi:hypothetical protein